MSILKEGRLWYLIIPKLDFSAEGTTIYFCLSSKPDRSNKVNLTTALEKDFESVFNSGQQMAFKF